ncbi:MAG: penicillin-binding transpeptidase domain-containing protein, partial [bacterium]
FLPHSFFVGFAPAEQPKVSVLVLVEHGKAGSLVAAPMARKILNFYAANVESFAGAEKPVLQPRFDPRKKFRRALRDAFAKPEPEAEAGLELDL